MVTCLETYLRVCQSSIHKKILVIVNAQICFAITVLLSLFRSRLTKNILPPPLAPPPP